MVPLRRILQKRFGSDFPVGPGTTKRDDPLVITDQRDYVSVEYGVSKFLLTEMGLEYKFEQQRSHDLNGRMIDELVYAAKEVGESEWTQTRRFFFDVSAGFNKIAEQSKDMESETANLDSKFKQIVEYWKMAEKDDSISRSDIPTGIYFAITDDAPPAEISTITNPIELCDLIKRRYTGTGLNEFEREQIRQLAGMPARVSFRMLRFMRALPNIALGIGIGSVISSSFSWVVLGLALFAKFWNGYARWLAAQGHPAAGLHVTIATLSLPATFTVSLLHVFRIFTFV